MSTMLSKAQWAESHRVTVKTVERWLAAGLVPQAERQGGRWWFPSGTPRPSDDAIAGATSRDVAVVAPSSTGELVPAAAAAPAPIAVGGTLEEFAAMTGCSPTGVRRLFADVAATPGLPFYVGRYGPHGAMRAVAFPRG